MNLIAKSAESSLWLEVYINHSTVKQVNIGATDAFELRNLILLWNRFENIFLSSRCSVRKIWENTGLFKSNEDTSVRRKFLR